MAKREVKCYYCGEVFDANVEEFTRIGQRYAHKRCYDKRDIETKAKEDMYAFLRDNVFGPNYDYQKIERQSKAYMEKYHYTRLGIYNAVKYWYGVKGNSAEKANGGIGIVPWIYDEAQQYAAYMERQSAKPIVVVSELEPVVVKVSQSDRKKKILDFDDGEEW